MVFLRNLECTGGGIPLVFRVGIGEKEPGTLGLLYADPEGMVLPNPAIGQSAGFPQAQVWHFLHEALHDAGGPVGRLIIYYEDLADFWLVRQGRNARRNDRLLIPGRNDRGDEARVRRRDGGADGG